MKRRNDLLGRVSPLDPATSGGAKALVLNSSLHLGNSPTLGVIEQIAKVNCHVREMLGLFQLAQKHGLGMDTVTNSLESMANDWLANNPNQAALFIKRATEGNHHDEFNRF